jgi:hypothetical protein
MKKEGQTPKKQAVLGKHPAPGRIAGQVQLAG